MDKVSVAKAFDQWMDDYINNPESFEKMQDTVNTYIKEKNQDVEPTYGQSCAELLEFYMKEKDFN